MPFGRIRKLIGKADQTLININQLAVVLAEDIHDFLEESKDGATITLTNTGEGTVWDFLSGKIKTLPIRVLVTLDEPKKQ